MGASVLNAAISTFLAIIPILFSKIFLYKIYFIQWSELVFFGLLYGLILLPILFFYIGDTKRVATLVRMATGTFEKTEFEPPNIFEITTNRVVPEIMDE